MVFSFLPVTCLGSYERTLEEWHTSGQTVEAGTARRRDHYNQFQRTTSEGGFMVLTHTGFQWRKEYFFAFIASVVKPAAKIFIYFCNGSKAGKEHYDHSV